MKQDYRDLAEKAETKAKKTKLPLKAQESLPRTPNVSRRPKEIKMQAGKAAFLKYEAH